MKPENTVPLTQYELIDGPELAARWKVTAVVPEFRRLCAVTSRGAEKRITTNKLGDDDDQHCAYSSDRTMANVYRQK